MQSLFEEKNKLESQDKNNGDIANEETAAYFLFSNPLVCTDKYYATILTGLLCVASV